jgi:hypothetical protein
MSKRKEKDAGKMILRLVQAFCVIIHKDKRKKRDEQYW